MAAIRVEMVWDDVTLGRALVVPLSAASDMRDFRVSPLGVVQGRKLRIVHDLTFDGGGSRTSVNADTDFLANSPCDLGRVVGDICRRILYVCHRHGVRASIMLARVDVKKAFRHALVDPAGVASFAYGVGNYVVVERRLQFGWRSSPRVLEFCGFNV